MQAKMISTPGGDVAVIHSGTPLITDEQSALDFAASAGADMIALNKAAITEDFFDLRTGIAGAITQKFVNYGYRLAIIGDFSHYTSKALRDYMYECNSGKHLYFVPDEAQALRKLTAGG